MKISTLILAMWLAASAWAQAPPPKQQPASAAAAKPGSGQAVSPSAKTPAPAKSGKKTGAATPQKANGKPPASSAHPPAQSSAKRHGRRQHVAERPSEQKTAQEQKPAVKGRRDPFVSPIVEKFRTNCTGSGRQCLVVGDIVLQGVIRYTGGYIAVVTSAEHTYFLHDNDPLADGDVERITQESITMRQRSSDVLGRPVVHEVTKKLGVPAV
jgi:type IV secretory pathway VirB10-like protein